MIASLRSSKSRLNFFPRLGVVVNASRLDASEKDRAAGHVDRDIRFGRFVLERRERRLLLDGQPVLLDARTFDLLAALAARAGHLLTKAELLAAVWPRRVVEESNLHVHVSALRKVLGPAVIATVPAHGYRFVAQVEQDAPSSSNRAVDGGLPRPLTSFIGHEDDLATLTEMIKRTRLVTLTGVGGCGKTRLAIKLAEAVITSFPGGVRFADLAIVEQRERVALAVAAALGVREERDTPVEDTLVRWFGRERYLIVLDNCEHLAGSCAALVERLLTSTSALQFLVTSRERLGVAAERVYPVRVFACPTSGGYRVPEALMDFEAVRLFIDRAREVAPQFVLTADNATAVMQICARLDGIPLALELAAARVKLLSAKQIQVMLDDRFRLLVADSHSPPRHQTFLATLETSYEHLPVDEQSCLCVLSTFVGGWTLKAATAICKEADDIATMDRLSRRVDKSLVLVDREARHGVRYRMLETVRQYAADKLRDGLPTHRPRQTPRVFSRLREERSGQTLRAGHEVLAR